MQRSTWKLVSRIALEIQGAEGACEIRSRCRLISADDSADAFLRSNCEVRDVDLV